MTKVSKATTLALATVLAVSLPAMVAGAPGGPSESMAAAVQEATVLGTWSTRTRQRDDGRRSIHVSLEIDRRDGGRSNNGFNLDADELEGLSFEQASGDVDDARFELVRDAGTIRFEGRIRGGRGAGTFSFIPDSGWEGRMAQLGYDDLSDADVFHSAIHRISTQYVEELRGLGYTDLPERDLFSFAIHGVSTAFITEMNGLGYRDVEARQLIQLRIHGVSPDWVREVRRAMGGGL